MKTVSVAEMVHIDNQTIEEDCVPGAFLMDWAGEQLALEIRKVYDFAVVKPDNVVFFAGKGNNGGDAFVAAKYLAQWGIPSDIYLVAPSNTIQGDAYFYLSEISKYESISIHSYTKDVETLQPFRSARPGNMIVVDALLGTGIVGEPRDKYKDAIGLINQMGENNYVVAVDIPSGFDGDTGKSSETTVRADLTVSMAYPKKGFLEKDALEYVGRLEVVDIGIERKPAERKEITTEFLSRHDVKTMFSKRSRISHKGTYGKILIVGGAKGFSGAPALSSMAALKSGAGLVSVLVPKSIASAVSTTCPEAMVHWGDETDDGALSRDALSKSKLDLQQFDAVLVGPGMTVCEDTKQMLQELLGKVSVPVVLDADALNIISLNSDILNKKGKYVMTPHAGELARLIDTSVDNVLSSRFSSIMTAVHKYNSSVILKGSGTIVALNGGKRYMNLNGNPGMATAGAGDVLGGLMAGFVHQIGLNNAICAAVFIHGLAGDIAAFKCGQMSITATAVADEISAALQDVVGR
jgi:ADP-dependent NAD(P)H-hydrate dehydratase / NAD(P)H-hydrate epimerase